MDARATLRRTFTGQRRYLIVRHSGNHVTLGDADKALAQLRRAGATILDLQRAVDNFLPLVGSSTTFTRKQIAAIAGMSAIAIAKWRQEGVVQASGTEKGIANTDRYVWNLNDAFVAGAAGSLSRQRLPKQAIRKATRCLREALEPADQPQPVQREAVTA